MFQEADLQIEHTEEIIKHHEFLPWVQRQECAPEVVQRLVGMIEEAPQTVMKWMQPQNFGTPEAIFSDHHIIIAGRKG